MAANAAYSVHTMPPSGPPTASAESDYWSRLGPTKTTSPAVAPSGSDAVGGVHVYEDIDLAEAQQPVYQPMGVTKGRSIGSAVPAAQSAARVDYEDIDVPSTGPLHGGREVVGWRVFLLPREVYSHSLHANALVVIVGLILCGLGRRRIIRAGRRDQPSRS